MRVKKYLALTLAAILATTMLTACPWEKEEDETDDASSVPVTSTDTSQDEDDDDGGGSGGDTGPTLKPTIAAGIQNGSLQVTSTTQNADKTFTVTVQAQPSEGYYVDSLTVTAGDKTTTWKRSGSQVATFAEMDAGTDITIETTDNEIFTITGIPEDATTCNILAEFAQYCVVTVNITGNGTVKINNENIDGNSKELKVIAGDKISIEATTDENKYGLASVMVGDKRLEKGEDGTFTVTPTEDTTVDVTFAERITKVNVATSYKGSDNVYLRYVLLRCTSGYETKTYDANYGSFGMNTEIDNFFLKGTEAEVTASIATPPDWSIDTSKKIENVQVAQSTTSTADIYFEDNGDNSWTFTIPAQYMEYPLIYITIADRTAS